MQAKQKFHDKKMIENVFPQQQFPNHVNRLNATKNYNVKT